MNTLRSIAANHPVLFVIAAIIIWLVLLIVFMGAASTVFRKPYDHFIPGTVGRLVVLIGTFLLLWALGWLKPAGVTRLGNWQIWLLTLGGLIYIAIASLVAFFGKAAFDFSNLIQNPEARSITLLMFMAGISEEIMFRGLVLYALVKAWGSTPPGIIGSVLLASLLFSILHVVQVFANGISPTSAVVLILQTMLIAVWWSAVVLLGGSIWPVVLLHFAGNAIVSVQALAILPKIEVNASSYLRLFWLSIPLALIGIWLLLRAAVQQTNLPWGS